MSGIQKFNHTLYFKTDFVFKSGVWRNVKVGSLISKISEVQNKVIVLGHSDLPITRKLNYLLTTMGAKAVIGFNMYPTKRVTFGLPLGITNNCDDSKLHRIFGNENHFRTAHEGSSWPSDFKNSIYLNFSVKNNHRERLGLTKAVQGVKHVKIDNPDFSEKGRINYLVNLREFDLIPCPVGNGIDTHRIWETLYMGGIPVVKRHPIFVQMLANLPVIFIDGWEELINVELMRLKWEKVNQRKIDFSNLRLSVHLDRIAKM
jgi:hypothetical protein